MIKLVIADDHLVVRQGITEMLEKRGNYSVMAQASNGEELLKTLNDKRPDIIIMDVQMPQMDGINTLQEMARRGLKLPVLVLSANEGERNIKSVLKAGAKGLN